MISTNYDYLKNINKNNRKNAVLPVKYCENGKKEYSKVWQEAKNAYLCTPVK